MRVASWAELWDNGYLSGEKGLWVVFVVRCYRQASRFFAPVYSGIRKLGTTYSEFYDDASSANFTGK